MKGVGNLGSWSGLETEERRGEGWFSAEDRGQRAVSEMEPDEIMLLKCAGSWGWRTSERLGGAIRQPEELSRAFGRS